MAAGYGLGGTGASTRATGASFTGAEAVAYTWTTQQKRIIVNNYPSSGVTFNVVFGGTASASAADYTLSPGDDCVSPPGMEFASVSVYSSGAATIGTHYDIRGWD